MNKLIRFIFVLIVALALVPFLPLYIERTMLRSWQVGQSPDIINWGWKLSTLTSYWLDYNYLAPEQQPALWLGVNLALGFIYAFVIALVVAKFFVRRVRGTSRGDKSLN
jgi:hypothetical protein